jgi:hypothetical protein
MNRAKSVSPAIFADPTQGLRDRSVVVILQATESRSFHSARTNGHRDALSKMVSLLLSPEGK